VVLLDRDHPWFRRAIYIEAVTCFLPVGALLAFGSVLVPVVSAESLANHQWDPWVLVLVGVMLLGWVGLVGIACVFFVLLGEHTFRTRITIPAVACGVVAQACLALNARDFAPLFTVLVVGAPLACTAHLVFLARRELFIRAAGGRSAA
jgi:hypothetical protein